MKIPIRPAEIPTAALPAQDLSEKERAFIDAARREAAADRTAEGRSPAVDKSAGAAAATPLDQPTVVGWDHPAARGPAPAASDRDRWTRVAELLKAERMAEEARRERLRRNGLGAIAALLLLVLVIAFATLLPGVSR